MRAEGEEWFRGPGLDRLEGAGFVLGFWCWIGLQAERRRVWHRGTAWAGLAIEMGCEMGSRVWDGGCGICGQ